MSDFMRKRLFIIGLLLAVLCSKTLVYAKDENLWEMRLYGWYVMMDDIFDLNKLYQDNRNMSSIEASEFLAGRALSYRREIYTQTEKLAAENMGYVIDEEGYADFELYSRVPNSSYGGTDSPFVLFSVSSGDYCRLNVSSDELKEFIEKTQ